MAILIANIGTSDLLLKVGEFWLPVGFDRNEPNLDTIELTSEEQITWKNRQRLIEEFLKNSLQLNTNDIIRPRGYHFKNLTFELEKLYKNERDTWHKQLQPGRILGIVKEAYEQFEVRKAYCFITDQPSTKDEAESQDTIYLFYLLKKWLEEESKTWKKSEKNKSKLDIEEVTISKEILPIDQDGLLKEYYNFFNSLSPNEEILISIKGGTPQMQTALRVQAMASDIQRQIFLEPKLVVKKLLNREPSECIRESYWQYMQTQKYTTVKLLLDKRWDFDGARVILQEWQSSLEYWQDKLNDAEKYKLKIEQEKLKAIVEKLDYAVDKLNFAKVAQPTAPLDNMLNLYTQCRLYWHLSEISNFLPRLGSFYEETLQVIIRYLSQLNWFTKNNQDEDWILIKNQLPQALIKQYENIEKDKFKEIIPWKCKGKTGNHLLGNRYKKRNFVEAIINSHQNDNQLNCWAQILAGMIALDFWVDKRNDLVHGSKGLSIDTMKEELNKYKANYTQEDRNNPYKPDPDKTCHYKNILGHMTCVCEYTLKLLTQAPHPCVGYPIDTPYYIYSDVKQSVLDKLQQEGLEE